MRSTSVDSSSRRRLPFEWGKRTYVMGILNCTPDSFSGDGTPDAGQAIFRGTQLVDDGADILDIGGESTRPGTVPVTTEEELRRVMPVIKALAAKVAIPVSIDTSKSEVADAALSAGASVVNDVWALDKDPKMADVVSRHSAWLVLMHNRAAVPAAGPLGGHYPEVKYDDWDVVAAVGKGLEERVKFAEAAGIALDRLIVDPGIGFGKTVQQNLEILRRLHDLKTRPELQDLPLLVGTSRKSVIGLTLGLPVEQRLEGTLATIALAISHGVDIVRVHDVREAVRCVRMADAIVRG